METFVTIVNSAASKFHGPASNFLGAVCDGGGSFQLRFKDYDGSAADVVIEMTTTDAGDGIEMKRVLQAIANAMQGYGVQGKHVKIADDVTGEYIHADLLSVDGIA